MKGCLNPMRRNHSFLRAGGVAMPRRHRARSARQGLPALLQEASQDRRILSLQQLKVARRKAQGLLLFFADVDNLKEINDSHGHREGDFALIQAADALERTFRSSDVIARLGGDEFAIMALEAGREDKEIILRRLKKSQ